jgi:hypothetical protein
LKAVQAEAPAGVSEAALAEEVQVEAPAGASVAEQAEASVSVEVKVVAAAGRRKRAHVNGSRSMHAQSCVCLDDNSIDRVKVT